MKKTMICLLVTTILILSGCGSAAREEQQTTGTTAAAGQLDEAAKLMAGTMLLETTDYPLDAQQADNLLVLWKGYNVISSSEASAEAEITALVKQIMADMSTEQLAAIDSMQLATDRMGERLGEIGIEMGGGMPAGGMDPEAQATRQALQASGQLPQRPSGGEMPSGGMPSNGGQMPSGGAMLSGGAETMDLGQMATMQAGSGFSGLQQRGTNTMLLNALINYLKEIVTPKP